jgi:hypothetical protein
LQKVSVLQNRNLKLHSSTTKPPVAQSPAKPDQS